MAYKYINYQSPIPLGKFTSHISKDKKGLLSVKDDVRDRMIKADAHIIWSITLYFSSKNAIKEGINLVSGIGYYYSLFHCIFSLMCLDFNIREQKLRRISHNQLTGFLETQVHNGFFSPALLSLFIDARGVREFINYLGGESGHDKFISLRHPRSLLTKSFGKIRFNDFINKLDDEYAIVIDEFTKTLKNIENHFCKNIFPVLHRTSNFDFYGEDFLENFFKPDCYVIEEVENYLFTLES